MATNLYLLSCALILSQSPREPAVPQTPPRPTPTTTAKLSEWVLSPKLGRAQELVYNGIFEERSLGSSVQFNREYRLESRVFVLDPRTSPAGSLDVAILTVLRDRVTQQGATAQPTSRSARIERAVLEPSGHLQTDHQVSFKIPLEGPPTMECGAFVEVPRGSVPVGHCWNVQEPGRPPHIWTVAATEMINGASCIKLIGVQKTDDWDNPRADSTAWRRTDTVWLQPRLGVAAKFERIIEKRAPARRDPTYRSVLRCELDSSMQYPSQLVEDRRYEILQSRQFLDVALPMFSQPTAHETQLTNLLTRINYHLDHHPSTPYRPAVYEIKQRVEAARRGEIPPVVTEEEASTPVSAVAEIGKPAPDFVAPDLAHADRSAYLHNWRGKPIVLFFYHPKSRNSDEVLRFAGTTAKQCPQLNVLTLAMTDDPAVAMPQHKKLGLNLPVLQGTALRISYKLESTPAVVIIDAAGIVRASLLGWGPETRQEVSVELQRILPQNPVQR